MSEPTQESPPHVSYAERLSTAMEEERKELFKKKEAPGTLLSEREKKWGEALAHLMSNEYFKSYLEFEAIAIAERLAGSFETPAEPMLENATLGEKLAFNKGRHFQMMYIMKTREKLIGSHLSAMKKQIKEELQ